MRRATHRRCLVRVGTRASVLALAGRAGSAADQMVLTHSGGTLTIRRRPQ